MMREDSNTWDLIIKAPWLKGGYSDYEEVGEKMERMLSASEMLAIDRFVILENRKPDSLIGGRPTSMQLGEMNNFTFGGEAIRRGYIFELDPAWLRSLPTHKGRKQIAKK